MTGDKSFGSHNHNSGSSNRSSTTTSTGPNEAMPLLLDLPVASEPKSSRRLPLTDSAKRAQHKLQLACVCSLLFMAAEVVGGFVAGSLAIMTDAAHLLSDVAGFCISLFAIWVTTLPASSRLSFGFQRAEVIGAITSVLVIWVLTGVLVYAAVERFLACLQPHPEELVNGKLMFVVACIGLFVNLMLMQILGHGHSHGGGDGHHHSHGHTHGRSHGHGNTSSSSSDTIADEEAEQTGHVADHLHHGHGHSHGSHHELGSLETGKTRVSAAVSETTNKKRLENMNVQAAYIHALGDFIQSVGVCIAGALVWYKPEWQIADPIATFVFSVLVLGTTVGIVRDSIHVLMEGTPDGIHADEIERGLRHCSSVVAVHDLHIWSLSAGLPSLSVHLVSDDAETALHAAQRYLISMGITHTTIQVEKTSTLYPRNCSSDLKCGQNSPNHGH